LGIEHLRTPGILNRSSLIDLEGSEGFCVRGLGRHVLGCEKKLVEEKEKGRKSETIGNHGRSESNLIRLSIYFWYYSSSQDNVIEKALSNLAQIRVLHGSNGEWLVSIFRRRVVIDSSPSPLPSELRKLWIIVRPRSNCPLNIGCF
jgi:hypothetical protein